MSEVPSNPKLYHITHVENLPSILRDGCLWSDAERKRRDSDCRLVGLSKIKQRRLDELEVTCHPGSKVGDYVPFYFCPRSVMLYILHCGNHPELEYRDGQRLMVHLRADLESVARWADENHRPWAFSDQNAGSRLAQFFNSRADLQRVHWGAVAATDFREPAIKEGKQAEFLLWQSLPLHLIEAVGVQDSAVAADVASLLRPADIHTLVRVTPKWYY